MGSIFRSSRRPQAASSCCCSTMPRRSNRCRRFGSIRFATRRSTSGTCSCVAVRPACTTPFAWMAQTTPPTGHRFNREQGAHRRRTHEASAAICGIGRTRWDLEDNLATSMRCAIVDPSAYDWEGDRPLRRPIHESIIYEVHVGGFTRSPTSGVQHPGTFAGMIEKIPVSPGAWYHRCRAVARFSSSTTRSSRSGPAGSLRNFWGYSTVGFFSPALWLLRQSQRHRSHQRVPRSGQSPAQGRHRSHPGRRLQSHRRRERTRTDVLVSRHRQPDLLPARSEPISPDI